MFKFKHFSYYFMCFCPVQWVETHPQCERMRLGDMQAKPHQRITKYPLLLKAVMKTTQDPHVQHTLRGMVRNIYIARGYTIILPGRHKSYISAFELLLVQYFSILYPWGYCHNPILKYILNYIKGGE